MINLIESIENITNPIESKIAIIYEHMLKWKYWKVAQCSSWTNSIFYSISDIIELNPNTNECNRINKRFI